MELKELLKQKGNVEKIRKEILRPGSISSIMLTEENIIKEIVYSVEESVSPNRDVIVPFYLPVGTTAIKYVYLNIYYPGLQVGDFPFNVSTLYLSPITKGSLDYKDGAFNLVREEYSLYSGNGATGSSYLWYRGYIRFQVAPLHGFKLTSCDLYWTLADRRSVGSGANTQHPNKLHAIDDFGILDKNDWSLTAQVDYGNVNVYTDTIGNAYSKDVKTRIQSLIDSLTDYGCFRFLSAEHTDVNNANNYHLNEPQLKCVLEEDASEPVYVSVDDGKEYFKQLDYYSEDVEDIDLTRYFSGTGKKQIKFSCDKIRRINILVRVGIRKI